MSDNKVVDLKNGLVAINGQSEKHNGGAPLCSKFDTFNFDTFEIRVTDQNGEPWFLAKDICNVLGLANATNALKRLDSDEIGCVTSNNGQEISRNLNIINESGLYSLILSSRKEEAKPFKRWVTHEVLPTIRKTGSYSTDPANNIAQEMIEVRARLDKMESIVSTLSTGFNTLANTVSNQTILINTIATDIGSNMNKLIVLVSDSNLERKQKEAIIAHKDRVVDRLQLEIYHDKNLTYLTINEFLKGLSKKLIAGTTLPMVGDYITREMIINKMGSPLNHPKNNTRTFPIYVLEDFFKHNSDRLRDI